MDLIQGGKTDGGPPDLPSHNPALTLLRLRREHYRARIGQHKALARVLLLTVIALWGSIVVNFGGRLVMFRAEGHGMLMALVFLLALLSFFGTIFLVLPIDGKFLFAPHSVFHWLDSLLTRVGVLGRRGAEFAILPRAHDSQNSYIISCINTIIIKDARLSVPEQTDAELFVECRDVWEQWMISERLGGLVRKMLWFDVLTMMVIGIIWLNIADPQARSRPAANESEREVVTLPVPVPVPVPSVQVGKTGKSSKAPRRSKAKSRPDLDELQLELQPSDMDSGEN